MPQGDNPLILLIIILGIYFLPSVIASNRAHRNRTSIFVLNLFLGWSLIGWVAALVWALSETAPPDAAAPARPQIDRDPYSQPVPAKQGPGKSYSSYIAGLSHKNEGERETRGARAKRYLCKGQILDLVAEPDNRADDDAIAIYRQGYRYGYIPAKHDWVSRALAEGREVQAEIVDIEKADDPDAQVFVKLRLQVS